MKWVQILIVVFSIMLFGNKTFKKNIINFLKPTFDVFTKDLWSHDAENDVNDDKENSLIDLDANVRHFAVSCRLFFLMWSIKFIRHFLLGKYRTYPTYNVFARYFQFIRYFSKSTQWLHTNRRTRSAHRHPPWRLRISWESVKFCERLVISCYTCYDAFFNFSQDRSPRSTVIITHEGVIKTTCDDFFRCVNFASNMDVIFERENKK